MSSILDSSWRISGVIDTGLSIKENIDTLATASGCWATFDIGSGKWSVVINQPGASIKSFNDSNIIGAITVSSTGINELYNSVQVDFPHKDLLDQKDTIVYSINPTSRFPNERDNILNFEIKCVNEPVQIEALAIRELKQSRIDKIVKFRTDFTSLGLKAGDIIDVTASMYGFSSKKFRILSIGEEDGDDNILSLDITAFEYDEAIYNTSDVLRKLRDSVNNIVDKSCNDTVQTKDDINFGSQILKLLGASMVTNLLTSAFSKNPITGAITQILSPKSATLENNLISTFTEKNRAEMLKGLKTPVPKLTDGSGAALPTTLCEGSTLSIKLSTDCDTCYFDVNNVELDYTITGVQAADITPFPLTGKIKFNQTLSIPIVEDVSTETETLVFTIPGATASIEIKDKLPYSYITNASPTSVTEGNSSTVTLSTIGVANGTSIPYTITGPGVGRVTTALTGNVTVNSDLATLTVATANDSIYTGNQDITVTFNPSVTDHCGQLDRTAIINIVDNDSPPAADTTCSYVSVPVVWCGSFDGTDNQLKGVTVLKTMLFPKPLAGESTITVPKTLTVTKGNPSTITVATTETIAAGTANMGGQAAQIITSFNSVIPKGLITGTTVTVYGYDG